MLTEKKISGGVGGTDNTSPLYAACFRLVMKRVRSVFPLWNQQCGVASLKLKIDFRPETDTKIWFELIYLLFFRVVPRGRTCCSSNVTKQSIVQSQEIQRLYYHYACTNRLALSVQASSHPSKLWCVCCFSQDLLSLGPGNDKQSQSVNTAEVMWEEGHIGFIWSPSVELRVTLQWDRDRKIGNRQKCYAFSRFLQVFFSSCLLFSCHSMFSLIGFF